jgi:hypothetical protein
MALWQKVSLGHSVRPSECQLLHWRAPLDANIVAITNSKLSATRGLI